MKLYDLQFSGVEGFDSTVYNIFRERHRARSASADVVEAIISDVRKSAVVIPTSEMTVPESETVYRKTDEREERVKRLEKESAEDSVSEFSPIHGDNADLI